MNGIPNQLGDDTAGEGFAHILKPALHRWRTTLGWLRVSRGRTCEQMRGGLYRRL